MKNSIIVWILALSLFNLTGCKHDPIVDNEGDERLVVVFLSANSLSSSLKSTASADEDNITEVILFGVDGNDAVVGQPHIITNPSSSSGNPLTVPKTVEWFYAIANPSDDMKNPAIFNPTTVTDLDNLTAKFSEAPEFPFLMSGIGEVQNYSAVINLERTIAKIEVIGKNGFVVETVTVLDTPDEGYVFARDPIEVPLTANPVEYEDPFEAETDANIVSFYVPENVKASATRFKVTGTLNPGKVDEESIEYTFKLKIDKSEIDIKRNTKYQVGISPINLFEGTIDLDVTEWDYEVTQPHGFSSYKDGIKILSIGNSFSHNVMQYLPDLLRQLGVDDENIEVVIAFRSSAGLNGLASNVESGSGTYMITCNSGSDMSWDGSGWSIKNIIEKEPWDIITLQQSSDSSCFARSYNEDLDFLIEYISEHATNPNYKLGWHMTWTWDKTATPYYVLNDDGTPKYGDQATMYAAICSAVQEKIVLKSADGDFDFIIPVGTAIQNARDYFGDELSHDKIHLDRLGCYVAAAMWVKSITHYDISKLTVVPPYDASTVYMWSDQFADDPARAIDQTTLNGVVKAVNDAYAFPFRVTP